MARIVSCLGVAIGGAGRGIIALGLAEWMILVAHVGVLTQGILGGIDRSAKGVGSGVASNCRRRGCFVVGIGTSDDNVEFIPPLSFVGSLSRGDGCTPQGTLEIGETGWVGAVNHVGIQGGVALDVHVECLAAGGLVAERGAAKCIIALQCAKTHVLGGAQRSGTVDHGGRIAVWGGGTLSQFWVGRVDQESFRGVRGRYRTTSRGLRSTIAIALVKSISWSDDGFV